MRLILVGNYPPDRQQSMERFSKMLEAGFIEAGHEVNVWKPCAVFGKLAATTVSGVGKWLGYLDKWVIFPIALRVRSSSGEGTYYHICDHSNAPYLAHLPAGRSSITCHDVLAIRGALGHVDAFCPASRFGRIFQKWILRGLAGAPRLAAVSGLTMRQLKELLPGGGGTGEWRVIHNAFNGDFFPMHKKEAKPLLEKSGVDVAVGFILHVGSDLARKNRRMLLGMASLLVGKWDGKICFAGHGMDVELRKEAERLGLVDRVVEVQGPDHDTLVALYSSCEAFVFPSYSEGFGWPLIEAQACGAPVIASNVEPMPEVSGGAAIHANPDDVCAFAEALLSLREDGIREKTIAGGLKNSERFTRENMVRDYYELITGKDGGVC